MLEWLMSSANMNSRNIVISVDISNDSVAMNSIHRD